MLSRRSGFERGGVFGERKRLFVGGVDDVEHVFGGVCDAVSDEQVDGAVVSSGVQDERRTDWDHRG